LPARKQNLPGRRPRSAQRVTRTRQPAREIPLEALGIDNPVMPPAEEFVEPVAATAVLSPAAQRRLARGVRETTPRRRRGLVTRNFAYVRKDLQQVAFVAAISILFVVIMSFVV
jgi:hypothetical protein